MSTCEAFREQWSAALVAGEEPPPEVAAHVGGCADCAAETRALRRVWNDLGELGADVPSAELRQRFDGMLRTWSALETERPTEAARAAPAREPVEIGSRRTRRRLLERRLQRWGMGLAALLAGVAIGVLVRGDRSRDEVSEVRAELRDMRQVLALSLLQQSTATGRLQGVSVSADVARQNPQVLQALLQTLATDPNPNVRLAVVDALAARAGEPAVQQRMGQALQHEPEPLVQIAIGDALLAADGARARQLVEPLLRDPRARPEVRQHLLARMGPRI